MTMVEYLRSARTTTQAEVDVSAVRRDAARGTTHELVSMANSLPKESEES